VSLFPIEKEPRSFEPATEHSVAPKRLQGSLMIVLGFILLFCAPVLGFLFLSQILRSDVGPVVVICAILFGPLLGALLIRRGKRRMARGALDVLACDPRPPVVYLRSFGADERAAEDAGVALSIRGIQFTVTTTEEEQISKVVRRLGPMIAIGRPNEVVPLLGAARMYVADEQWQDRVLSMMNQAALVLMRAGKTEGFWWEVETAVANVRPERIVWLVPFSKTNYSQFAERANLYLPKPIPTDPGEMKYMAGSLKAWLWFEKDWTPHLEKVVSGEQGEKVSPVGRLIQRILEPVFVQIGAPHLALRCALMRRVVAGLLDFLVISPLIWLAASQWDNLLVPVAVAIVIGAYFVLCDLPGWGGTVGKRIMKLRVVDEHGRELSTKKAVLRGTAKCLLPFTLGPACSLYIFFVPLVVPAFSVRRRTPHDVLTRTFVIGPAQERLINPADAFK
jgi:uncharacterized RDD family membrane protein YckC